MNYYQHHLGDYLRDTAHLSILEDGVYHRLLAAYYVREKPLPIEHRECCKLARATTAVERKAVAYILEQFFSMETDGYHQKRADEELAEYQSFIEKQRANGKSGARTRWEKDNQRHSGGNGSGNGTGHSGGDGDGGGQTIASHLPSPNSQSPIPSSNPQPPFEKGASRHRRSEARAEKDTAVQIWDQLLASDGARPPRNPNLQAAIDAAGGWSAIKQRTSFEEPKLRKQFCDAYRSAAP
jgi:uncharacterized protein YdaU (DUF1376 family)